MIGTAWTTVVTHRAILSRMEKKRFMVLSFVEELKGRKAAQLDNLQSGREDRCRLDSPAIKELRRKGKGKPVTLRLDFPRAAP